jgi:hypothetical protein
MGVVVPRDCGTNVARVRHFAAEKYEMPIKGVFSSGGISIVELMARLLEREHPRNTNTI